LSDFETLASCRTCQQTFRQDADITKKGLVLRQPASLTGDPHAPGCARGYRRGRVARDNERRRGNIGAGEAVRRDLDLKIERKISGGHFVICSAGLGSAGQARCAANDCQSFINAPPRA